MANYVSRYEAIAMPACTLENNVLSIINYFLLLVKRIRGGALAHFMQVVP